ncbi:MAG: hypothetical protein HC820_05455 [Hydrococcus sp. RM1_1_31]|nr:hypothetical protein [Hydrococcus sp. RM1_1_31]
MTSGVLSPLVSMPTTTAILGSVLPLIAGVVSLVTMGLVIAIAGGVVSMTRGFVAVALLPAASMAVAVTLRLLPSTRVGRVPEAGWQFLSQHSSCQTRLRW